MRTKKYHSGGQVTRYFPTCCDCSIKGNRATGKKIAKTQMHLQCELLDVKNIDIEVRD